MRKLYAESPVLTAEQSLESLEVEEGFTVQLVAAEPQVIVPVAMTFDESGRLWVAEMTGYMPDTVGTGEDAPNGRIVILEDTTGDGAIDKRTVFLDSLILPRALCFVENGLLVAEPPRLWYVEVNGDKAGKKTLVDAAYTEGGNVEHQPNGLLRAMDNWIYNAKSSKRYRKMGNRWLKEDTHFRGQWGISQDNYGRLFYNNNSENVLGDYFSPGLGSANPHQRTVDGFNRNIVPDNRVYPIRATPGVNRGYMNGVLDDSLRLVNFTAACGPLVYRGGLYGDAFEGNIFVAEPSANLIKRNIVRDSGYFAKGRQAYKGREFLASTDERFRPVNLHLGPDGAMYVLDMYRGIIQHKTYLTPYLKNEIGVRNLSQPLNCGRIYRVLPKDKKNPQPVQLTADPEKLLAQLDDRNGWVRDKAQQMLVDGHYRQIIPALRARLQQTDRPLGLLHAMWTLEGLQALEMKDIVALLQQPGQQIRSQALAALPSILNAANKAPVLPLLEALATDPQQAPAVAYVLPTLQKTDAVAAARILKTIWQKFPNDRFVADAVISNVKDKEEELFREITAWSADTNLVIRRHLKKVITDISNHRKAKLDEALVKEFPRGNLIFKTICQTCHGADGDGIQSLAPPLNHSEIVTGRKERLIAIVLYGLTGPVEVNGKVYKAPEISGDMPGIIHNDEFSDGDIAQLMSFIRNAWGNKAEKVTEKDILKVKQQYKGREKSFTMEELQ
ncbi:DUF7133 domain-containing protein [Chitinophaga cymbidii]|uniref:Cytochrome c domain-containing protein n=1 Tax=Chitinophaga cymbidii TaxID=1096750 RepID=A0A512RNK9_9BACT|nr:c-type cytochrome [Chitinophaga cymbidii]GEP97283.1 hypothetical protein CCY01nite_35430 [Chitinophaga cymbidii]